MRINAANTAPQMQRLSIVNRIIVRNCQCMNEENWIVTKWQFSIRLCHKEMSDMSSKSLPILADNCFSFQFSRQVTSASENLRFFPDVGWHQSRGVEFNVRHSAGWPAAKRAVCLPPSCCRSLPVSFPDHNLKHKNYRVRPDWPCRDEAIWTRTESPRLNAAVTKWY